MERLTHTIWDAVAIGDWVPFIVSCHGLKLSYLSFTNDLVLFNESPTSQTQVMLKCLENLVSRAKVSIAKTKIFWSKNTKHHVGKEIIRINGFELIHCLDRYLGVQCFHGKIIKTNYSYIVERARKKLTGLKSKNLSLVGRLTLTQSTLSTLPNYVVQTVALPKSICSELDSISRKFLLGGTSKTCKVHLVK